MLTDRLITTVNMIVSKFLQSTVNSAVGDIDAPRLPYNIVPSKNTKEKRIFMVEYNIVICVLGHSELNVYLN